MVFTSLLNSLIFISGPTQLEFLQNLINPKYSLEGLTMKLKLQYFSHLMQRAESLEKPLLLGKIEGRRRNG